MKTLSAALIAISLFVAGQGAALAEQAFGPAAWPEYRLNASNNAVFDNGAPALPDHHFKTSGQVRATPVVVGNRLYVGNHATGGLFAFNVRSGEMLWGSQAPDWRKAPNWVHADMIYADGRLYLGYGNRMFQSPDVRGTGASGVMALDPDTGATLWNHATRGEVMPAPAYWNGQALAATGAGRLLALDAATGEPLWQLELPGWVSMSSPTIKNDILYVGALNSVAAVDLKTREPLWTYHETGSFTDVPPAISADGVVVMTAVKPYGAMTAEEKQRWPQARQYMHFVYGFDAVSGELLWKTLMGYGPKQRNNTSGAPAIAHGRVYVGSPYTNSFFSFDVETGEKLWEYRVNAAIKAAPVINNGHVFFGDTDGYLHVLNAETGRMPRDADGKPIRKRRVGGSVTNAKAVALAPGGPIIINNTLFVGSQDGFVYRIPIPAWLGKGEQ